MRSEATAVAGVEHSPGSPLQVQGKCRRVLELLHDGYGEPANLAFETHGWQRPQPLNVGDRFAIKERKSRQRHFISTASCCVVRGTYKTRDRGALGSSREPMTAGRVLAATPAGSHRAGGSSSRSRTSSSALRERATASFGLPDLDQAKSVVLNSLPRKESHR